MRFVVFLAYFAIVSVVVGAACLVLALVLDHLPGPLTLLEIAIVVAVAVPVVDGLRNRF